MYNLQEEVASRARRNSSEVRTREMSPLKSVESSGQVWKCNYIFYPICQIICFIVTNCWATCINMDNLLISTKIKCIAEVARIHRPISMKSEHWIYFLCIPDTRSVCWNKGFASVYGFIKELRLKIFWILLYISAKLQTKFCFNIMWHLQRL